MFKPILLLLHIICYCNTLHSRGEKELGYSDVLKNITIANKILQDLINNYERMEKIYQSEEFLQMQSTTRETNQKFKSLSVNKPKKEQQARSNRKYTSKPFMGTAMIYETSSNEIVGEKSNEETKKVKNNRRPVQPNINNYISKQFSKEDLKKRFKILNNTPKKKISEPNSSAREATSQENSESTESEEVEQIIIDIPNEVSAVVVNTPNERIIKSGSRNKPITNIWGTKTRFSIQHTPNRKEHTNLPKDDTEISRDALRNRNKSIEKNNRSKIIYNNKMKKNTSTHKPARLKTHKKEISQIKNNPRSKNKEKIILLIITNNKKANYDGNKRSKEIKIKDIQVFPSTYSQNDIILRSEYGDTCLQMPIKKCKKALKNVNRNICKRRFKCKSDFKSDFIQNSKDGCIEEFAYTEIHADNPTENETNSEKYEKFSPPEFRELKKKTLKCDGTENKSSVKALAKKKLQKLDHFISLRNETPLNALLRLKRDRYEKMCQKESLKKCNKACSYALKETCSTHICEKRKKKAIKSECKTQCKIAFKDTKKRGKSSSTSDDESDSDSESDNESDSDNESESYNESESDSD